MPVTKYKGVIFDFNGTLFFDSDKHERAWKKFSIDVRGHQFTEEEMATHVHGRTNRSILEYLLNREIPDDVLQYFVVKKEDFYKYMCLQDTKNLKLVEGAAALLDYLTQNKIKINIATSSETTNLQFFIEQFHLEMWFDINKIIYDDYKIKGKPSPEMYLAASQNLGIKPSECIVFEDSESGVQSANAAGIGEIIIIDPKGKKSDYNDHPNVDLVIEDFTEFNAKNYF